MCSTLNCPPHRASSTGSAVGTGRLHRTPSAWTKPSESPKKVERGAAALHPRTEREEQQRGSQVVGRVSEANTPSMTTHHLERGRREKEGTNCHREKNLRKQPTMPMEAYNKYPCTSPFHPLYNACC